MKKILFVIPTLGDGGAERSFLSLLQSLDKEKYSVDIFALRPTGLISEMLPDWVNVLELPELYNTFTLPAKLSAKAFLKKGRFKKAVCRLLYSRCLKKNHYSNIAEQKAYKYFSVAFDFKEHYDAAISYLEKTTNYIVSEKVDADIKIGYIHSDYTKLEVDRDVDLKLMRNLDHLVTVSDKCAEILKENLPEMREKVCVIENIILPELILKKATEFDPYHNSDTELTRIVTVGRISYEKGPDIALEAYEILRDSGYKIEWHMVGDIKLPGIIQMIEDRGAEEGFILDGLQKNPYPYIYKSDIYVQPSRYEGKSIAIEEAKVLGVPIVLNNYPTAPTQIQNNVTGIIAREASAGAVAEAIKKLIDDKELYLKIKSELKKVSGNKNESKKFESLLGE